MLKVWRPEEELDGVVTPDFPSLVTVLSTGWYDMDFGKVFEEEAICDPYEPQTEAVEPEALELTHVPFHAHCLMAACSFRDAAREAVVGSSC